MKYYVLILLYFFNILSLTKEELLLLRSAKDGDAQRVINLLRTTNPNIKTQFGTTPLISASQCEGDNYQVIIKELIKAGAEVNATNDYGTTSLMHAAKKNAINNFVLLLQLGADPCWENRWHDSALTIALSKGFVGLIKILMKFSAVYEKVTLELFEHISYGWLKLMHPEALSAIGAPLLFNTLESQDYNKLAYILELQFFDIDLVNTSGESLLIKAIRLNNPKLARLLIRFYINIDAQDRLGMTACMWAAALGRTKILKILIKNGANLNLQDKLGFTAAHWARASRNAETIQLLFKSGADFTIKNSYGKTAKQNV